MADEILQLKCTDSTLLKNRLASFHVAADILDKGARYHSVCLLNQSKKVSRNHDESESISDKYVNINADFVALIKRDLSTMGTIDMNQLVKRYEALCAAVNLIPPATSMKPFIRRLIQDHRDMSSAEFYQFASNKPAVLANKKFVSGLVCRSHFNDDDDLDHLATTAKEIRKELSSMKSWEFSGSFDDFNAPLKLTELIKCIISDNKSLTPIKKEEVDTTACNIVQFIYSNFKSDRQLNYQSTKDRGFEKHRMSPLSVGTALLHYKHYRSKKGIDFLAKVGLSINYDKLERILTSIASTSLEISSTNEIGIVLPACFKKGIRPIFAADNIDIGGDVSSFHGADLITVQDKDDSRESIFPVSITQY